MSVMASENVFLSALQPNTSVTTYGLPSEIHLGNGGTMSDEMARARRVQQQVQMRLAEKSTLPRQNGTASRYAMSGTHQHVSLITFLRNCNGPLYVLKFGFGCFWICSIEELLSIKHWMSHIAKLDIFLIIFTKKCKTPPGFLLSF